VCDALFRSYVAVAPQLLRPGNEYDVSVTVLTSSGPVAVTASLQDNSNATVVGNQTSISSGNTSMQSVIIMLRIALKLPSSNCDSFNYS